MNEKAYAAIRTDPQGVGVGVSSPGVVKLTGRDRAAFLNGQVTNDVTLLKPGQGQYACLLNNTGHLLAYLSIHAFEDHLLLETYPGRANLTAATLERFLIRERVEIEVMAGMWRTVHLVGGGAMGALVSVMPGYAGPVLVDNLDHCEGDSGRFVVGDRRLGAIGLDWWMPAEAANQARAILLETHGAMRLDTQIWEVLRIEAGAPRWGAELDESVIPLEAGMSEAISFTKGCYMGQEIIARIHSRGHTNRSLTGFKLSTPVKKGERLVSESGQEIGRITSVANSPTLGPIALGYVRNEYLKVGATVFAGKALATIASLPFLPPT